MGFYQLKELFDPMPIAFTVIKLILNDQGQPIDFVFCYANPALAVLEGVPLEELNGKHFFQDIFVGKNDSKWLEYYYAAAFNGETFELREFSPEINKYLKIICYPWIEKGYSACVLFDETALVQAEQKLHYLALYDEMTKCKNRNAYESCLQNLDPQTELGLILIDLNGLKKVNDQYGHEKGDFLFQIVVDRINRVFNMETENIFRIGGDEFMVVLPGVSQERCKDLAVCLREQMRNAEFLDLPAMYASVGWSWGNAGTSIQELKVQADHSMYEDKRTYYAIER